MKIMKSGIFSFLFFFTLQLSYSYEFIPFLESFEFEEDEYEISFSLNSEKWILYEEAENSDFVDNRIYYIKLNKSDLKNNDDTGNIRNPVLVLQLHGHWFEFFINGEKIKSNYENINRFSYHFIPLSDYKNIDEIILKTNSTVYGSFTMYLTDYDVYSSSLNKFYLYPFFNEGLDFIVSVVIAVVGLLSLVFFLFSRSVKKYIYVIHFIIFSFLLAAFHILSTDIILTFIPVIPEIKELIEMAAFDSLSLIVLLIYIAVFEKSRRLIFKILIAGNIAVIIINIAGNLTGYFLPAREILSFAYPGFEYLIIWMHLTFKVKNIFPAKYFKYAFITLAITYLSQNEYFFGPYLPDIFFNIGLITFYVFIALIPVTSYLSQDKKIKEQYIIFKKFVPEEFLNFLSKDDITQIRLGDQTEKDITVLFSDIRSFTSICEKMKPQEIFNYLNSYLEKIGPVVRKHNGFIDKYIGDSVMALFPNSPQDAVDAAVEIQNGIEEHSNVYKNLPKLNTGIGIHSGKTMLGIIGENERIESTVISDTVNTASRLEHLTKTYKTSILFSEEVAEALSDKYETVSLGNAEIRGKDQVVNVYTLKKYAE